MSKVEVDYSGIRKLGKVFKGMEADLEIGLFDSENASKGAAVEFGDTFPGYDNNQQPRPWMTTAYSNKSRKSYRATKKAIVDHVKSAFKTQPHEEDNQMLADELADILRTHLQDQDFPKAGTLKEVTKIIKSENGSLFVDDVGIDTGEMVRAIEGREV
tara:strand:+ start:33950 stop:34423 length:474 start_codon:yes stop_codon:yes gene_type:complete